MNYVGFGPEEGHVVPEDVAYDYALERCLHGTIQDQEDFRKTLVRWFYSDNWVEEDGDDDVPL